MGGKDEDAVDIVATVKSETGITSVDDFVKFFKHHSLCEFYDKVPRCSKKAPVFVTMHNMLDGIAKAQEKIKQQEESAKDNGERMDPELNETLMRPGKRGTDSFSTHPWNTAPSSTTACAGH